MVTFNSKYTKCKNCGKILQSGSNYICSPMCLHEWNNHVAEMRQQERIEREREYAAEIEAEYRDQAILDAEIEKKMP